MLELVPRSPFSRQFILLRDGQPIAELALGLVRERGSIVVAGTPYEVRRERLLTSEFVLSQRRQEIARARKTSAVRNRFEVTWDSHVWELVKVTWWGRAFAVREGGTEIGSMRPEHAFTRRSLIDLPDDVPVPVAAFLAALAVLMWNRDQSAAAAAGS